MSAVVLACALFCLGLYGVLTRREIVAVLAAIEVMLGGATLLLVVLASSLTPAGSTATPVAGMAQGGQAVAVLLLTIVAAEAATGLALLVALVNRGRARMTEIREVRG